MFSKILIANRGEIACRVIKTARRMKIATVAVYSDADANALHVRSADQAVRIGPAPSRESYLRGDVIIEAALKMGAQAIHPGYGFLSENEDFAAACAKAGLVFIGPSPEAINAMGLKDKAKDIMAKAGVPVVPGYQGADQNPDVLKSEATKIGYPVLIKAVAGGGGKGMRLVEREADFAEALTACKREATASFGNDRVLIEKYINKPRHIEVQVFGDSHGNAVYMFERDCSLQRRHQKVVEEAPAPGLSEEVRAKLGEAAVKAVKALKYTNAGTIEFIMDSATQEFYFMEMNTRLQVEHPVTEAITGLDLVEWQLRVAAGEKLPKPQKKLKINGHAFEVRLYAEDAAGGFLPQIGRVSRFIHAPDVRTDTGIEAGDAVSIYYDPMIAKLIVHGKDRAEAAAKMHVALEQTVLAGLTTNQEFLGNIFAQADFLRGDVDTGFIARHEKDLIPTNYGKPDADDLMLAGVSYLGDAMPTNDIWGVKDSWRMNGAATHNLAFFNKNEKYNVIVGVDAARPQGAVVQDDRMLTIFRNGRVIVLSLPDYEADHDEGGGAGQIVAPMPGRIIDVMVAKGQSVKKDQPLVVMEAMKMQMTIRAGCDGIVDDVGVATGQQVPDGALLVSIAQKAAA